MFSDLWPNVLEYFVRYNITLNISIVDMLDILLTPREATDEMDVQLGYFTMQATLPKVNMGRDGS
jgi:hypothetical protein